MSCGVGGRRGSDPSLLWLWRRPVATARLQPLAWELPYAMGVALKNKTNKKKRKKETLPHVGGNVGWCNYFKESFCNIWEGGMMYVPCDPAFPLPEKLSGMCTCRTRTCVTSCSNRKTIGNHSSVHKKRKVMIADIVTQWNTKQ